MALAIAKMNMFQHDYTDSFFSPGDRFRKPHFAVEGTGLKRFNYVVANPIWKQYHYYGEFYKTDFGGLPGERPLKTKGT